VEEEPVRRLFQEFRGEQWQGDRNGRAKI